MNTTHMINETARYLFFFKGHNFPFLLPAVSIGIMIEWSCLIDAHNGIFPFILQENFINPEPTEAQKNLVCRRKKVGWETFQTLYILGVRICHIQGQTWSYYKPSVLRNSCKDAQLFSLRCVFLYICRQLYPIGFLN